MKTPPPSDALLELFSRFESHLHEEQLAQARELFDQLRAEAGEDHPEVAYAFARLSWAETDDDDVALPLLSRVIELDARHAEAHYDLGCIHEARDDDRQAIEHFLRVRALDAENDYDLGIGTPEQIDHIERVAREVLDGLPSPFAERLEHVPVMIERRPSRTLVADGFDPRAYGLFEGAPDVERDAPVLTRIVLFASNLLAEFPEEPLLGEQIEVTLLHEIGHFFGLDEDDMKRLELD